MTLNEFYNEVSRRADTAGTKINVAETRRVLSEGFLVLQGLDPAMAMDVFVKGLLQAKKKLASE